MQPRVLGLGTLEGRSWLPVGVLGNHPIEEDRNGGPRSAVAMARRSEFSCFGLSRVLTDQIPNEVL